MILAKGKLYGEEEREVLLARLEDEINETRVRAPLRSETVIAALDALGRHIENGQFDAQLAALGLSRRTDAVRTATAMLRREIWNTVCTWNWECLLFWPCRWPSS